MSLIRPNRIGRRWLGLPISTPRALFNNGENGLFLDFSDIRSLYTDASGTTPVAAPGDTIRLAADKSRARSPITAYAGVQANTGLAPRFGRAPKSRRQLWRGDSGIATGWSAAGTTPPVVTNGATRFGLPCVAVAYDQTMTPSYAGSRANSLAGAPIVAGRTYVGSVDICLSRALVGLEAIAVLVTGANGFPGLTLNAANSAAYVGQWLRAALPSGTPGLSGLNGVYTHLSGSLTSPVTIYLKNVQWEEGATPTAYQAALSAYDLAEAGYPSFGFARLDTIDDIFATTLTLAQTGDVLLFGRGGSWIEPGRVFGAGGTLTIGVTGTTITPGILHILGDLVGIVAIGRALSTDERNRALRYFQAAGAAGFLNAGADGVVNGAFASDTIWTKGTGWTIGGGVATHAPGTGSDIEQAGLLVAGQLYLLSLSVAAVRATSLLYVHDGSTYLEVGGTPSLTPRVYQVVFRATANRALSIRLGSLADVDIDNVSLQPLTVGA